MSEPLTEPELEVRAQAGLRRQCLFAVTILLVEDSRSASEAIRLFAAESGAALVTYDNGGCRDYARDGETALVAKRRDVDDLAAKLERVASEPELRARLSAAGARLITTAFDWDRSVARMEALFRQAGAARRG